MSKVKNLIGQKFNHLTVVKRGENAKTGEAQWWCQCDCGNQELILVTTTKLTKDYKTHCNKCKIYVDLTNCKFGMMTVVSQGEDYIDNK